jgi:AraC family transcriptional regulator
MEWSERMGLAIDYIENNLDGEIDLNHASKLACCSIFHFQKMFCVITGLSAAEYIRHRRLTLAVQELTSSKAKVIDVSLKYGYDSPDSFTRAFRNMHGITPQAARESGVQLVAYPRISFQIVLKGGQDMDYKIIDRPAFEVMGKSRKCTNVNKINYQELPRFWGEIRQTPEWDVLCKANNGKPGAITGGANLGVCIMSQGMEEFTYAITVERPPKENLNGLELIQIPASKWAVFECIGSMPKAIQDVNDRIYEEWFPSTGFENAGTPDIEVYMPGDMASPKYRSQIWVPIKDQSK